MRLVSLTCSNTEIIHSLGLIEYLVGVDDHSDYPAAALSGLPRVGPDLGIDVARVAALKPDLVLASLTVPGHERVLERLLAAGLPVLVTEPISVSDIYADIFLVAERVHERMPELGLPVRAQRVVQEMRDAFDEGLGVGSAGAQPAPGGGLLVRRPNILVEWWPRPVIVPGRDSWVNQLLIAAGAQNPMAERPVKSAPIELSEALEMQPDAIVIAWCGVSLKKYRPSVVYAREEWRELPAILARRVYRVPEAFLGRPSPRLVDGLRCFRSIVSDIQAGRAAPDDALARGVDLGELEA